MAKVPSGEAVAPAAAASAADDDVDDITREIGGADDLIKRVKDGELKMSVKI